MWLVVIRVNLRHFQLHFSQVKKKLNALTEGFAVVSMK